jgi:hypothetical protein
MKNKDNGVDKANPAQEGKKLKAELVRSLNTTKETQSRRQAPSRRKTWWSTFLGSQARQTETGRLLPDALARRRVSARCSGPGCCSTAAGESRLRRKFTERKWNLERRPAEAGMEN